MAAEALDLEVAASFTLGHWAYEAARSNFWHQVVRWNDLGPAFLRAHKQIEFVLLLLSLYKRKPIASNRILTWGRFGRQLLPNVTKLFGLQTPGGCILGIRKWRRVFCLKDVLRRVCLTQSWRPVLRQLLVPIFMTTGLGADLVLIRQMIQHAMRRYAVHRFHCRLGGLRCRCLECQPGGRRAGPAARRCGRQRPPRETTLSSEKQSPGTKSTPLGPALRPKPFFCFKKIRFVYQKQDFLTFFFHKITKTRLVMQVPMSANFVQN